MESYPEELESLFDEWERRIISFRDNSMAATDPTEVTRLRAKADTLSYARAELMNTLEEMQENQEKNQSPA
jgi:predicted  nucleic acid-binding Zn-ribbon protein